MFCTMLICILLSTVGCGTGSTTKDERISDTDNADTVSDTGIISEKDQINTV